MSQSEAERPTVFSVGAGFPSTVVALDAHSKRFAARTDMNHALAACLGGAATTASLALCSQAASLGRLQEHRGFHNPPTNAGLWQRGGVQGGLAGR